MIDASNKPQYNPKVKHARGLVASFRLLGYNHIITHMKSTGEFRSSDLWPQREHWEIAGYRCLVIECTVPCLNREIFLF